MISPKNVPEESRDERILVVDDEPATARTYSEWLRDTYEVYTANSGNEALQILDETIDVVLLDRRLPDISGEDLVAEIRDADLDCRVAVVSAMEPDLDVLEMGFDVYLEKPVSEASELRETVTKLLQRSAYDEQLQELLSLASKKAALEATTDETELSSNEEYAALVDRIATLQDELSLATSELDDEDLRAEFHNHG